MTAQSIEIPAGAMIAALQQRVSRLTGEACELSALLLIANARIAQLENELTVSPQKRNKTSPAER